MTDDKDHFKGKRITLMGLGRLGRGIGDARFLASCGADVLVTDLKSKAELAESVAELEGYENITFVLGEHREEDFVSADLVIKGAGVPLDSPYISAARKATVPVRMSTALFAELTPAMVIGVTGTRGKTTVTHMIADILTDDGKNVFRGGNLQGVSTLEHLPESTEDEIAVLELDSWQLQGFGDAGISPHIAVFTTFFKDHLNYYGKDLSTDSLVYEAMQNYFADKAQIFLHQKKDDVCIMSAQVASYIEETSYSVPSTLKIVHPDDLPGEYEIGVPGEHNRLNAQLAREATRELGVPDDTIRKTLHSFTGVPGRLEKIKEINGVEVYNDTTATTPDATIVALQALGEQGKDRKNIILILGGADKRLDMSGLFQNIQKYCKKIVLLPGTGTDHISKDLRNISNIEIADAQTMNQAVEEAFKSSHEGNKILLSPAFASFGLFQNEYDRGDKFIQAVNTLS